MFYRKWGDESAERVAYMMKNWKVEDREQSLEEHRKKKYAQKRCIITYDSERTGW